MATDRDLVTEAAESATTQAVVGKSTPTLTAGSGTQQGASVRHLDRDEGEGLSSVGEVIEGSHIHLLICSGVYKNARV